MIDAALIKECADPSLKPAIIEAFVEAVAVEDPLAVTVKSGGRLILVAKVTTSEDALAIIRQYAGQAVVRVGLTQFPAGIGVRDAEDLNSDLLDPCQNLRKGTGMFAKVLRIVTRWYGNPATKDVFPAIFEDAIYAWKTGSFEGVDVFRAEEPGEVSALPQERTLEKTKAGKVAAGGHPPPHAEHEEVQEIGAAGIRVDLSRIGGQQ